MQLKVHIQGRKNITRPNTYAHQLSDKIKLITGYNASSKQILTNI